MAIPSSMNPKAVAAGSWQSIQSYIPTYSRLLMIAFIIIALFSALEQTHCVFVACDSK